MIVPPDMKATMVGWPLGGSEQRVGVRVEGWENVVSKL